MKLLFKNCFHPLQRQVSFEIEVIKQIFVGIAIFEYFVVVQRELNSKLRLLIGLAYLWETAHILCERTSLRTSVYCCHFL